MRKLLLIAKREYIKQVTERTFLFLTLGMPVLMVVVLAISLISLVNSIDDRPVGIVDHAGLIDDETLSAYQEENTLLAPLRLVDAAPQAREALEAEEIQGYYVIPEAYPASAPDLYYGEDSPNDSVRGSVEDLLRRVLIQQQPAEVQERLAQEIDLSIHQLDGERSFDVSSLFSFLVPMGGALMVYFAIALSSGYMLDAISEEKTNYTMEILASSVTPQQLIAGKAIGLMGVVSTLMLVWGGPPLVGGVVASRSVQVLADFAIPWIDILLVIAYFIPTFVLVSAIMISVGAIFPEQQQAQPIGSMFTLFFTLPLFFFIVILNKPQHPMVVGLSLFPTTAFLTTMMRWAFSEVPVGQLIVSWVILTCSAGGMLWASGRVFRVGMLRYGKRMTFKGVLAALRGERPARRDGCSQKEKGRQHA